MKYNHDKRTISQISDIPVPLGYKKNRENKGQKPK